MPILLLSTLFIIAGCGAASGLEAGGSPGSTSGTTSSGGSGGSTATTSSAASFPVGTFTACAKGFEGPDGNVFLNSIGILESAALTVAQEGGTLAVTYVDTNGANDAFTFAPTSDTSAALAPGGAVDLGFEGDCVQGPGANVFFPATMTAAAGTLTYEAGTMFLSLVGTVAGGDGTPCGAASAPARVWVICGGGEDATPAPPPTGAQFPAGSYACTSQIATHYQTGSMNGYTASGGTSGTLTVTQSGTKVTAAYTGDTSVSGTLDFTVTTPASAGADPGQTLLSPCMVPPVLPGPPETMAVAAGSLVMNDATLFLMFSGSIAGSSSCSSTVEMGSLLCTKQ